MRGAVRVRPGGAAGEHPVGSTFPGDGPYPLPFHPLEVGDAALRGLLGFVLESRRPDDVDPFGVHLHGFRVADPTGREAAEREARTRQVMRRMRPPQRFRPMPDGQWREIGEDPETR
ncbi:DUF6928 family protein [Dactylosporangium siamense]|uniref:DUF6928 family protein n=1 Tax=Dactylosporangium siamense TaxID=685454 RepID=UPI00360A2F3D